MENHLTFLEQVDPSWWWAPDEVYSLSLDLSSNSLFLPPWHAKSLTSYLLDQGTILERPREARCGGGGARPALRLEDATRAEPEGSSGSRKDWDYARNSAWYWAWLQMPSRIVWVQFEHRLWGSASIFMYQSRKGSSRFDKSPSSPREERWAWTAKFGSVSLPEWSMSETQTDDSSIHEALFWERAREQKDNFRTGHLSAGPSFDPTNTSALHWLPYLSLPSSTEWGRKWALPPADALQFQTKLMRKHRSSAI